MVKSPPACAEAVRRKRDPWAGKTPGGGHSTPSSVLTWHSMDRGAWRAAILWVAKSLTRLKRLSVHAR